MLKIMTTILVILVVLSNSFLAFSATPQEFNVKNYGAKGDGVTDDRSAIQSAIDAASAQNGIVLFPAATYKISNYVSLKSNITLSGYGATIYMPSQSAVSILLYSKPSSYISNVTIKGLKLASKNDRTGSGEYEGSMTSNVEALSIYGVNGLTIQDVYMENMYMGLKLQASDNGQKNTNVNVDNLKVYNTRNPLYMSTTNGFTMSNSILDASGGGTKFLHAAYFRGGLSNLTFDNVQFNNTPGGGIHIYNSKADESAATNIVFNNSSINNTRAAVYLYSNANNITFNNLTIKNSGLGFKVNSASNIKMNGVTMTEFSSSKEEKGGFSLNGFTNSELNNVTIDGSNIAGSVFSLVGSV
ncbi:MAG TPA: glycosyl hydrolase family 28-related protein, partial [Fusibacter sp.]|nr:glycosyl hydrolase family 28-related protein [Fusibacter sp.]